MEGFIFAAPVLLIVVMGLIAAIGLPGSRRSWETPPAQPQRRPAPPQQRAAAPMAGAMPPLPTPPPGYAIAFLPDGRPVLVPNGGRS